MLSVALTYTLLISPFSATSIVGPSPTSTTPAPPHSLLTPSTSVSSSTTASAELLAIDAAVTRSTFKLLSSKCYTQEKILNFLVVKIVQHFLYAFLNNSYTFPEVLKDW